MSSLTLHRRRSRRGRWVALVALALGLGFAAIRWWYAPEPSAGGKTLSEWLYPGEPEFIWIPTDLYGHIHDELWNQLIHSAPDFDRSPFLIRPPLDPRTAAIRQMGTNAIPWLLEWMDQRENRLDDWMGTIGSRLPGSLRAWLPVGLGTGWSGRAGRWQVAAFDGFVALGVQGVGALPALRAQLDHGDGELPLTWAVASLGPEGIDVLATALGHSGGRFRDSVALALGLEGEVARPALPALVDCVERGEVSYDVLGAIGRIDPRTPRLLPALLRWLGGATAPPANAITADMAVLLLGLQRDAGAPALPWLKERYVTEGSSAPLSRRRLLRRAIRSISPAAAMELPAAASGEDSDEWP